MKTKEEIRIFWEVFFSTNLPKACIQCGAIFLCKESLFSNCSHTEFCYCSFHSFSYFCDQKLIEKGNWLKRIRIRRKLTKMRKEGSF